MNRTSFIRNISKAPAQEQPDSAINQTPARGQVFRIIPNFTQLNP
jgi:hypothetical protein